MLPHEFILHCGLEVCGALIISRIALPGNRGEDERCTQPLKAATRIHQRIKIKRQSAVILSFVRYAASAVTLTLLITSISSSTCSEVKIPSGPCGVRSVNGDS